MAVNLRYFVFRYSLPVFGIVLAMLLAGCDNDPDPSRKHSDPPVVGLSAYIQAIISDDNDGASVGTTLYDSGAEVSLVGGDAVRATNMNNEVVLQGQQRDFTFYKGTLDIESIDAGIDFSIDYLPVEARSDRWYPSDLAYVDAGEGEYVGLNWHIDFPEPIYIDLPIEGSVYRDADDLITIDWINDSNDVDNMRINAYLHCARRLVEIYDGIDSGSFSLRVRDLFDAIASDNSDTIYEDLFESLLSALTLGLVDLDSEDFDRVDDCTVSLFVLAEYEEDIGPPFVDGSIIASRSTNRAIIIDLAEPLNL